MHFCPASNSSRQTLIATGCSLVPCKCAHQRLSQRYKVVDNLMRFWTHPQTASFPPFSNPQKTGISFCCNYLQVVTTRLLHSIHSRYQEHTYRVWSLSFYIYVTVQIQHWNRPYKGYVQIYTLLCTSNSSATVYRRHGSSSSVNKCPAVQQFCAFHQGSSSQDSQLDSTDFRCSPPSGFPHQES